VAPGKTFPETEKGWGAGVRTLPDFLVYAFGIRNALAILMTTVGFVLMIACANVAGLLLARSAGRRKELAVPHGPRAGRLAHCSAIADGKPGDCLSRRLPGVFCLPIGGIPFVRANLNF